MPTLRTDYRPGEVATETPMGDPADNSVLEAFIARRMAEYEDARKKQIQQGQQAQAGRQPTGGVSLGAAPRFEYEGLRAPVDERQRAMETLQLREAQDAREEAKQERAYRSRLRQIDLAPPVKFIEGRPGVIGGYAPDVTALPLSYRPSGAGFVGSPDDDVRANTAAARDQNFNARLRFDRTRGY